MLLALSAYAYASSYDPELTWRTIETEHFRIHFHQGEEQLVDEFSVICEDVWDELTPDLRWTPRRRVEVVLVDRTDQANGYATITPWNTVVMFVTAPQEDSNLGNYDEWLRSMFTHEFTHILQLDTNHGIVRLVRRVIGRVASTNELSPLWMVEGYAVYEETLHSAGGRGRSPSVQAVIRTYALGDPQPDGGRCVHYQPGCTFPPLGNLDGLQALPPSGNLRYLFGDDLIVDMVDRSGPQSYTKYVHLYGSSIPYLLPGRFAFDAPIPEMYRDWRAHAILRAEAQAADVDAEGHIEGGLVSDPDASCAAPSYAPDGKLVWTCSDPKTGSAIWLADVDGTGAEVEIPNVGAKNFTWRSDSKAFVFASTHTVNRFNTWSDVYLHELGSDGNSALTTARRARDPEFSPDGSKLYVVTNSDQQNALQVLTVDRHLEPILEPTDHTQLSTPRFRPDGQVLAMSVWKDGCRDLWLYTPDGEPIRRLTADRAIERDPEWSPDGEWLYFSSERGGIPNIYAIEIATDRIVQVTNVYTSAIAPSVAPDGHHLAYAQYSTHGWEVRVLDLDAVEPIERGLIQRPVLGAGDLPANKPAPVAEIADFRGEPVVFPPGVPDLPMGHAGEWGDGVDSNFTIDVDDAFGAEDRDYPFTIQPKRYNIAKTAGPAFWLPFVQLTPYPARTAKLVPKGGGEYFAGQVSALTGGTDTLRMVRWSVSGSYRSDADFVGGAASFTLDRWLPTYSLSVSRVAVPYGILPVDTGTVDEDGQPILADGTQRYWEKRTSAALSVSYPYTPRTTIFGRYALTQRLARDPIPDDAYEPSIPARGYVGALSGGWRYAFGQNGSATAISPEDVRVVSFVGSLLHPWLGTRIENEDGELEGLTQVQATGEVRQYWENPWIPDQVLAVRLAGGATIGRAAGFGSYQLGGNIGDAGYVATPDEFRMLRGHPLAADSGDMYWLTGAEYRVPIKQIDRGLGVIPLFVRNVSVAGFVDAGNAFDELPDLKSAFDGALVGVGGEVRVNALIGFGLPISLRGGWAAGLDPKGYAPGTAEGFYLTGGSSF